MSVCSILFFCFHVEKVDGYWLFGHGTRPTAETICKEVFFFPIVKTKFSPVYKTKDIRKSNGFLGKNIKRQQSLDILNSNCKWFNLADGLRGVHLFTNANLVSAISIGSSSADGSNLFQ
jgi:hypothetical protein